MTHSQPPIVVGVDGSASGKAALDWAIAEAESRRLPLLLISAWGVDYAADALGPISQAVQQECRAVLRDAEDRVRSATPDVAVTTHEAGGTAAAVLIAESARADTVVVGARGLGPLRGAFVGSTSMQVTAHASCPVVVVRQGSGEAPSMGVVVGVDGSQASAEAVGYAFAHASQRGAGLTAVHAWDIEFTPGVLADATQAEVWARLEAGERALTAESLAGWAEKYPDVEVRTHVVRGHAVKELAAESEDAGLVVIGSRGRGGFRGLLLGSVAQGLIHRAHCPVAVVRPRETDASKRD